MTRNRLYLAEDDERMTELGSKWNKRVQELLKPLILDAIDNNIAVRDVTTMVIDQILLTAAEQRIISYFNSRKQP
jgi:hypothetical protein